MHETLKDTRPQLVIGVDSSFSTRSTSGEPTTRAPAQDAGAFFSLFTPFICLGTTSVHLSLVDSLLITRSRAR